jgi:acyl-CoA synthetase (AMP-forming)/AMP-acid ligase II
MGPIEGEFRSTLELFDAVLDLVPDREAFVDGERRITFEQWAAAADGVAAGLQNRGVREGDVVCLRLPSSIDYAVAYQAALRLGAITSGINPRLGASETAYILERSDPKVVIDADNVREVLDVEPGDPRRRWVDADLETTTAIVWTSGTTGRPKGAVFDHGCMKAMAEGAPPLSQHGDRKLSPLPFAHIGYMTRVWDELSYVITTIICPVPWRAETTLATIARERVTVCQGVPTQYRLMFDHPDFSTTDVSSLRIAGVGASRVPPELVVEMGAKLRCDLVQRYTSTEACLSTGTRVGDPPEVIATTVGRPNGGVELRLTTGEPDDPAGLSDVEPGEVGTVTLRSRAMMRGYWRDPDRTAEAITPDGWLVTGDLGRIGGDGNLRLVGRHTEMYIRGGYNVYPAEIENLLGDHPAILASAVVGAPAVNDTRGIGEVGVLFAVARDRAAAPELAEVRAFVKERLADYKAPDALVLVDELPVTAMGKIDKQALRPRAEEEAARWHRHG